VLSGKPKLQVSLRIFGEMDIVTIKDDTQGDLKNYGLTFMFVGYSVEHTNGVF
jgi:hypothetical protein